MLLSHARTPWSFYSRLTMKRAFGTYRRVAHRDSKAVGESVREREDQAFINAITDFDEV